MQKRDNYFLHFLRYFEQESTILELGPHEMVYGARSGPRAICSTPLAYTIRQCFDLDSGNEKKEREKINKHGKWLIGKTSGRCFLLYPLHGSPVSQLLLTASKNTAEFRAKWSLISFCYGHVTVDYERRVCSGYFPGFEQSIFLKSNPESESEKEEEFFLS